MNCDRCKKENYYAEPCNYCNRIVCRNCQKSSLTASKTKRRVICKDCWSDIKKRRAYKSA